MEPNYINKKFHYKSLIFLFLITIFIVFIFQYNKDEPAKNKEEISHTKEINLKNIQKPFILIEDNIYIKETFAYISFESNYIGKKIDTIQTIVSYDEIKNKTLKYKGNIGYIVKENSEVYEYTKDKNILLIKDSISKKYIIYSLESNISTNKELNLEEIKILKPNIKEMFLKIDYKDENPVDKKIQIDPELFFESITKTKYKLFDSSSNLYSCDLIQIITIDDFVYEFVGIRFLNNLFINVEKDYSYQISDINSLNKLDFVNK